ncbi:MAG: integrase arm-type DNA-binding domain-containing protein [Alphaproteobacteria bacterium]
MAREFCKLTAMQVRSLNTKGFYADGGNLYLQVSGTGAKSWIFRFMMYGKAHMMGLGATHVVSLAEARHRAAEYRRSISDGIDPLAVRKERKEKAKLEASRAITFKDCAVAYIKAHEASWKNEKHAYQWTSTLEGYAYPVIGKMPVHEVNVEHVLAILKPIWKEKTETASRLRGRIESVLNWAYTMEYRRGENPAVWKGRLENLLSKPSKTKKIKHHDALHYDKVHVFMADLAAREEMAARALEMVIYTASRTGEVIGATWPEFDLDKGLWIIPGSRMKAGREHRVPLSGPAIAILRKLREGNPAGKTLNWVFLSGRRNKPLSNMAMLALLKRMERTDITVHGFRSTFRDWAAEQTNYPSEIGEAALAHISKDKTLTSYLRSDFFEKRRQMMSDWASWCLKNKGEIHSENTPVNGSE